MSIRPVQVVFASTRSTADRVMIDRIQKERNPKTWIVVSSDNDVLDAARRKQMQVLKSAEFAKLLERPTPPDKPGPDEAVDVHLSQQEVDEWLTLFKNKRSK